MTSLAEALAELRRVTPADEVDAQFIPVIFAAIRSGELIPATEAAAAIRELQAERDRLRDALESVAKEGRLYGITPHSKGAQVWFDGTCGCIARAALRAGTEGAA